MGTKFFLFLDDVLILANSYYCQMEPTQDFTHQGLGFNTWDMTLLLSKDKVLKTQATKVAPSPTCRGMMRPLGLTSFASSSCSGRFIGFQLTYSRVEVQPRGNMSSPLVVILQTTTKVNTQAPSGAGSDNGCLQECL